MSYDLWEKTECTSLVDKEETNVVGYKELDKKLNKPAQLLTMFLDATSAGAFSASEVKVR